MAARSFVRSRSTHSLLHHARAFLAEQAPRSEIIVLAPTRAAAAELALSVDASALLGAHSWTLTQLAAALAAESLAERSLAPISRLGIEAFAARIVHSAARDNALPYFAPVAHTPGFPRALARTLAELRLEQIPPDRLGATGPPGRDLATLLLRYEAELEQHSLADLPQLLALAAAAVTHGEHRFHGLPLLLLDIDPDSRASEEFLSALIEKAPALFAASTAVDDEVIERLTKLLGVHPHDLDTSPAKNTVERVRTWLFSTEDPPAAQTDPLLLFSAPGENLECVEIARRIRELTGNGLPFDRIAILLRGVDQYQPLVEEALRRAAIPGYFSRGAARPDPAGRAFLSLLACAAECCSASRFAEYLSLGQVPILDIAGAPPSSPAPWVPPADDVLGRFTAPPSGPEADPGSSAPSEEVPETTLATPRGWERLIVDAAVIGGPERWSRRLAGLRAELQTQIQDLGSDDPSLASTLAKRMDQLGHLEHFTLPLIKTLSDFPANATWGVWLESLAQLAQMSLRAPESVLSVLSELEAMSDVGPVSIHEVYDVLSEKLGQLRNEPLRRRYGAVFVGSIEEARGRAFDVVFVPGLAEGLFPRRSLEDPLLLDEYREKLSPNLETQERRGARERMLLRSAAASAVKQLVVSYPRMDTAQSRARVPSFYALEVVRSAEGRLPSLQEFEKRAARAAPSRLDWPAPIEPSIAIDDAEYDLASLRQARTKASARYLMLTNPALARSFRARWQRWAPRWSSADGLVNSDSAARELLAARSLSKHSYSASSLQQFATCPYRFLLHGIYRFRPREVSEPLDQMDPLTRGALFHAAQFELFADLSSRQYLPVSAANLSWVLDITDRILDRVAARFEDELAPAIPRVWKAEVESVRIDLRGWLQHTAAAEPDWVPVHFEYAFGMRPSSDRDSASTPEEATIFDGVRLRGSIDLIERHATRNVLRVIDHKTGKAPATLPRHVAGGATLQPLLYALAVERLLGEQVESAGLYFCTQRGDFQHIHIRVDDHSKNSLERVLHTIDQQLQQGFLPAAPQKGACAYCDYNQVCGPYEEQRVAKKTQDSLDPLIELRNMP